MELRIPTVNVSLITSKIPTVVATEPKTICSKFVENCDYAARSKDLNAWDVKVKESNIRFSFNTPTVGGRRARDRGRNRKMRKKRNKKRSRSLKKNKNKNKKNKKNKNKNRERVRGQKGPERNSDDICPEGWVMIVEGEPKIENPYIILNKTCLSDIPGSVPPYITVFSDRAQVYFQNGTGRFKLTAEPAELSDPSKCLDDCEWKENPFSQVSTFWRIGGWNVPNPCGVGDKKMCARIQFSMSLIPEQLSCLNDCFSSVNRNEFKKECQRGIQTAKTIAEIKLDPYYDDPSDDQDIDCILFNRMPDPKDRDDPLSPILIPEIGQRRKKSYFPREDSLNERTKKNRRRSRRGQNGLERNSEESAPSPNKFLFSNFLPTDPLDRALVFCIMANLDARFKMLSVDPNKTGEFHDGNPIWGRNETCSDFLPKLNWPEFDPASTSESSSDEETSPGSPRRTSHTRSSGPSSAIIER